MKKHISDREIAAIINTSHHDPFQILGMHALEDHGKMGLVIRAFLPDAQAASAIDSKTGERLPLQKLDNAGFFEGATFDRSSVFPYKLEAMYENGVTSEFYDSYSFIPSLGEMDLYLFNEGNHLSAYEKLGAHIRPMKYHDSTIGGISFAVWAPNAQRVSVVGDFNSWDGRRHVMRTLGGSGVWEIFVPGLPAGQNYKYEIKTKEGHLLEKSDPYAFYAEVRPKTASKIYELAGYQWQDQSYLTDRAQKNWRHEAVSIYEVHLGSWMRNTDEGNRFLTYRELAPKLVEYVKHLGYTHIELLPITEHPLDISWGYQVTGFYASSSRFGSPKDFMYFVDLMHQNNIGVILDWVPAHFPKDAHGLAKFDGTPLYEHADPRQGEHKDWATLIFNFGRAEVKNFLISNALFWLDKFHLDGLRVDAVASMLYLDYSRKAGEWVPNKFGGRENLEAIEFMKYLNSVCYKKFPGIMNIAEESTAFAGVSKPCEMNGLGFGFKWNMGWMHDTLEYFQKDPIYRKYHHNLLTFPLIYAFHENFVSVLSHDEVVHGKCSIMNKMPGDFWQKFANARLLYAFMWMMPGKKLLFMGQDFGQWIEWNCNQSLDWHLRDFEPHRGLERLMSHLNHLYKTLPCLHQKDCEGDGFEWIDFSDSENSVVIWLRKGNNPEDNVVFAANFTPIPRLNYRIGLPQEGFYREILNTDSELYYGSNVGNMGGKASEPHSWQERNHSMIVNIPPLGMVGFRRD
jgi:1,4-alpha-glucan branching enzyme